MDPVLFFCLAAMWLLLFGGNKIRDRKLERRKVELQHQAWIENLHLLHAERMKLIETKSNREIDEQLAEVADSIAKLEKKALD
jgi:hypothetical protein